MKCETAPKNCATGGPLFRGFQGWCDWLDEWIPGKLPEGRPQASNPDGLCVAQKKQPDFCSPPAQNLRTGRQARPWVAAKSREAQHPFFHLTSVRLANLTISPSTLLSLRPPSHDNPRPDRPTAQQPNCSANALPAVAVRTSSSAALTLSPFLRPRSFPPFLVNTAILLIPLFRAATSQTRFGLSPV
ncbi:hypothetical protein BU16DRAFT_567491 [Lophium mytilinum]|uniref:Uncharacterized protein n=1 Tax=Lophium mytilinum TaxID=390894 RepID=A0A6A6QAZ3_9PEZI|nr:hypothetical protein BU16DRAFT_567491 [Lophium mytilinum]